MHMVNSLPQLSLRELGWFDTCFEVLADLLLPNKGIRQLRIAKGIRIITISKKLFVLLFGSQFSTFLL